MHLVQNLAHVNKVLREERRNVLTPKTDIMIPVQSIDLLYQTNDSQWQHVALCRQFIEVGTSLALRDLSIPDHVLIAPPVLRPGEEAELAQAQTISVEI